MDRDSKSTTHKEPSKLAEERIQKLDEIGFIWDLLEYEWQKNYKLLKQYVRDNGNSIVPTKQALGPWISTQRQDRKKVNYQKNAFNFLTRLILVGIQSKKNGKKNYQQLKQYIKENGDAKVPYGDQILGPWVSTQRQDRKKGRLSEKRIQLLDEIDFSWDPVEEEWQKNYQQLKQYIKESR